MLQFFGQYVDFSPSLLVFLGTFHVIFIYSIVYKALRNLKVSRAGPSPISEAHIFETATLALLLSVSNQAVNSLPGIRTFFEPYNLPGALLPSTWWNPGLDFLWIRRQERQFSFFE
jgi:hypothetical protein